MMPWFDKLLVKLARPRDVAAVAESAGMTRRLRLIARVTLRFFWAYLLLVLGSLVWTGAAGMDVYHRTEMPEFCHTCHEMGANFKTWSNSRHESIKCIDCHARPGIGGWLAAKTAGLWQLYTHVTAKDIKDIKLGERHEHIVSDNCQRCHRDTARSKDRRTRAIAHTRHTELGIACTACHSGNVAHPNDIQAKDPVAGLVDTGTCFECHDGGRRYGEAVAFNANREANCTRCHPDAVFATEHFAGDKSGKHRKPCLDCHERATADAHFSLAKQSTERLCARCHDADPALQSRHKPFADGQCSQCHRVMVPAFLFANGPKPDRAFCLSCHDGMAAALAAPVTATVLDELPRIKLPMQASLTLDDDDDELHKSHLDDIGDSPQVCGRCHAGHGGHSQRGLIRLKGDDGELGTHKATATGGTCTGACHDDEVKNYRRRAMVPAAATPTDR